MRIKIKKISLQVRLIFLFIISFSSYETYSKNIVYTIEASSYFPKAEIQHRYGPHVYTLALAYHNDLLPFFFYQQNGVQLAYGAMSDFSLENRLLNHLLVPSGIYGKFYLKPVTFSAAFLPDTLSFSAKFYESLIFGFLTEGAASSTQRDTASVSWVYSDLTLSFFSSAYFSSLKPPGMGYGTGYLVSGKLALSPEDGIGVEKIVWNNGQNISTSRSYFLPFYRSLDHLRNGSSDDWVIHYSSHRFLEKVKLELEAAKFLTRDLHFIGLRTFFPLERHINMSFGFYALSQGFSPVFYAKFIYKGVASL